MIIRENTRETVSNASEVVRVLRAILAEDSEIDRDKEHLWSVGLNTKNVIKFVDLVSLGTLTGSLVGPREFFRLAVKKGVASLICIHNHPSGDPTPSRDDLVVTQRLKSAGDILGITLLDHVIIGDNQRFVSLKERGDL